MVRISVESIRAEVTADARKRRSPNGLNMCTSSQRSRRVCVLAPAGETLVSTNLETQEVFQFTLYNHDLFLH